tara:strand:- start:197 stop:370 length:174 start_codon:yes stop_codon:yes gene_type:complete
MLKKSLEILCQEVLRQANKVESKKDNQYRESNMMHLPTPDELEAMLIFLNKDKLPHA